MELCDPGVLHLSAETLRQQYRRMALKYHPDKNKTPDAGERFRDIHSAYQYLSAYTGANSSYDTESDCDSDCGSEDDGLPEWYSTQPPPSVASYKSIFGRFVKQVFHQHPLVRLVLHKISNVCEASSLEYLRKMDKTILIQIYETAQQYNDVFQFSEHFLLSLREMIQEKSKQEECVILHPLLGDLFNEQLYKLSHNGQTFIIPLWHNELVYDVSGVDLTVRCCPVLPDNIELDEHNNLLVHLSYSVGELWNVSSVAVYLDTTQKQKHSETRHCVRFNPAELRLLPFQTIVLKQQGIPRIHTKQIYDVSNKSDIILHIHLKPS